MATSSVTRSVRRRRAWIIVCSVIAVAAAAVMGALGLVQHRIAEHLEYLDDPFAGIEDRPAASTGDEADGADQDEPAAPTTAMNILVLGSDSRISAGDPSQWSYGAQRTDAIMLVHIAADRSSVQVMSIPRDSWVSVPGYGMAKINAAYSYGGPTLLIQTVENLTGVRIDHFAIADFESFALLTDQLGGVEINLPNGMNSRGVELSPGTHLLTGDQALVYVRERYSLPGGDFDRVKRQQNWMRAILRTAFNGGVLTNPIQLSAFLETAAGAMAVDPGFTIATMRDLALSLRDLRPGDVTFMTVPIAGTGWSDDGQSIVNLDRPAFAELMEAVVDDELAPYIEDHPDLTILGGSVR